MGVVQGGIEGGDTAEGATTEGHPGGGKAAAMVQDCRGK